MTTILYPGAGPKLPEGATITIKGEALTKADIAAALTRTSLERQLQGIQPNSVQEILEDSLELWLLKHGHLK